MKENKKTTIRDEIKRSTAKQLIVTLLLSTMTILLALANMYIRPIPEPKIPVISDEIKDVLNKEVSLINASGQGAIVHNIPGEMTVGRKEIIEVRIAKSLSADLTQSLEGNGDPEINRIKVLPTMGVVLDGTEDYFNIRLKNKNEEKTIMTNTYANWIFEVTPAESGEPDLYLTTYMVLDTPEGKRTYELPTVKKSVLVHSNPIGSVTSFITANWKEILGFLIGAGFVGWILSEIKLLREKKKNQQKPWEKV